MRRIFILKKYVLYIFIFSLFLFSSVPAFSREKKEREEKDISLLEIDRLIRKTEYDEALKELNNYLEKNPENFDNAQTRIARIMNAKKQYSILAEKLIDIILTDPNNNKEIYEITARLERFERHPSDANLQFIADLKKSAEFNYFRALFTDIQNESAQLTSEEKYTAAIEKTKEGFWLYKENYEIRWEDNPEILAETQSIIDDINLRLAYFENKDSSKRLHDSINLFLKDVNAQNYDAAVSDFSAVKKNFTDYAVQRNKLYEDGYMLQNLFSRLKEIDSDATDASFLPFMFRFVFGIDSVPLSGLAGAINGQFNDIVQQLNLAVFEVINSNYMNYAALYEENIGIELEKAKSTAQLSRNINNFYALDNMIMDLYDMCKINGEQTLNNPYNKYVILNDYLVNLVAEADNLYSINGKINSTAVRQKSDIQLLINSEDEKEKTKLLTHLLNSTAEVGKMIGEKSGREIKNLAWSEQYLKNKYENWIKLDELYTTVLEKIFTDSFVLLNEAWSEIAAYYSENSNKLVLTVQTELVAAEKYKTGFYQPVSGSVHKRIISENRPFEFVNAIETDSSLDFGVYYSYPDISKLAAIQVQKDAAANTKKINDYEYLISQNFNANPEWKNDEGICSIINQLNKDFSDYRQKLEELRKAAARLENEANSQGLQAQLAKNEADIRFAEAEAALRRENFEMARKKLQDALSKYDESLNIQNNESLRNETDSKLMTLGERITKGENEIVVREVRELKTLAKDAYFNGRFDDAEKYLNQARIRWAVTNSVEDEEILNLQNFVNTAISMKTGREILPSAPQYPEMSQLLNIAYQYYNEGEKKISSGNKAEGLKDLELALENIQKLQYVYPLHQESAILTLKINRLKDPKKFESEFKQKIQNAKQMCKNVNTRQQGYANLLDYYELDKDYPGLKDLIYQTEIDIGIRQKPVDNSSKNKAKNLYNEANKIYNSAGTNVAKLNDALSKIEQSLKLNSEDSAAMVLKDKITTAIGGNTISVLSTDDERLYQLAIQRLQNNNVIEANAILMQILKKPQNGNIQKVKDLQVKIEARS